MVTVRTITDIMCLSQCGHKCPLDMISWQGLLPWECYKTRTSGAYGLLVIYPSGPLPSPLLQYVQVSYLSLLNQVAVLMFVTLLKYIFFYMIEKKIIRRRLGQAQIMCLD